MQKQPVTVVLDDQAIPVAEGQSLLDALLQQRIDIPHACRLGHCRQCLLRLDSGLLDGDAARTLKPSHRERGYFLACQCRPRSDLQISRIENRDENYYRAERTICERLCPDVWKVGLQANHYPAFQAGQFIRIRMSDSGEERCYSIANRSNGAGQLELHVRVFADGGVSPRLTNRVKPPTGIEISEPLGDSIYAPAYRDDNFLLVGTGTGMAPLFGMLQEALANDHRGTICLYHGAQRMNQLYLHATLREIAHSSERIQYIPCVSREQTQSARNGYVTGEVFKDRKTLSGWRVFLSGHPEMVKEMARRAYLAGAATNDINSDPFYQQLKCS